jgi:predicted esterase YcpF (UPF0227 family)
MTTISQIFHHKPENSSSKLLYLMGSTWKTKNMFDLDMKEKNFRQLLNDYGIETFTYDIPETSYEDYYNIAESLVKEHKIDNIFGYCIGGVAALQLAKKYDFNSIVVFDAFRPLPLYKTYNENKSRYECNKDQLLKVINTKTKMNIEVKEYFMNSLPEIIYGPDYVLKNIMKKTFGYMYNEDYLKDLKVKKKYLMWSAPWAINQKEVFTGFTTKGYDASHWILLEQMRYELAKDLSIIVK